KIPYYVKTKEIEKIVEIKGLDLLNDTKDGKILVTAHIGNWEVAGAGVAYFIKNLNSLAYRIKNKKLNRLITEIRENSGIKIIFHDQPLKDFVKALKNGKTIAFLVDQNALAHRGIFVDFFNLKASTVTFPAKLALKYKKEVFFSYNYYDKKTNKIIVNIEKLYFKPTGNYEEDLKNLVQTYTKKIEEAVRKHPDQYFWVHKRWKTRPEGQPENIY
ncbi:lysophospholipid acyltransferase family protein, partial [Hydrogenivirga sp. 128-5-R1-1]|uniref:lysophospholipid acyltransferase family protein n=1 Tax=Hydrogenivirga sp. 128-5-R1-1 TaxID=392423 RepID=UPI00015F01F5